MLRPRHINTDLRGRAARLLLGVADVARWPFERFAWLAERRLVWPLRERAAGRGPSGRTVGATALAALAAAAVAVGFLWPAGGNGTGKNVTVAPTRVAIATPTPAPQAEQPQGPALHGAPPSFGVGKGVGVSKVTDGETSSAEAGSPAATPEASTETAPSEGADSATTSSKKPVPAGPEAMKVARRFSEAFVFYEVGAREARAKTVFGETASPQLATALADRPPRLPEDAKVPKARVVNLVAGPRAGKAYTVSVSLLRVGLTSELRLEMRNKNGEWTITDVRG
ncbi:MAG TPA: hypothetical protein VLK89_04030 [Solirubrobacterales bacterium]|nr:hypothetical protein [Solirubrobacterales bacterium]